MRVHNLGGRFSRFYSIILLTGVTVIIFPTTMFADTTSVKCDSSASNPGQGLYACTLNYSSKQGLSFDYEFEGVKFNFDLSDGTIAGEYNLEIYTPPSKPGCVYLAMVAANDTTAKYPGEPKWTVIPAGTSTSWCQFLGASLSCPINSLGGFSFSDTETEAGASTTFDYSNSFSIDALIDPLSDVPITVGFDWNISTQVSVGVSCVNYTSTAKNKVTFPAGGLDDFITENVLSEASQAYGCPFPENLPPPPAAEYMSSTCSPLGAQCTMNTYSSGADTLSNTNSGSVCTQSCCFPNVSVETYSNGKTTYTCKSSS